MIIRDFYFAAWLIERGYCYDIDNGVLKMNIVKSELIALKGEYGKIKPYFDKIKRLVKTINSSRNYPPNKVASQLSD